MFYKLRTDLDKLNNAVYITKIIRDVTEENENCYRILQLFLNTLYVLSETDKNPDLIISTFKLKLLCILGFTPRIDGCVNCKQQEDIKYFSLKDNGFKCEICGKQDKSCLEMSESTINAIKYIVMSPPKKLYSFNLKDEALEELKLISKLNIKGPKFLASAPFNVQAKKLLETCEFEVIIQTNRFGHFKVGHFAELLLEVDIIIFFVERLSPFMLKESNLERIARILRCVSLWRCVIPIRTIG